MARPFNSRDVRLAIATGAIAATTFFSVSAPVLASRFTEPPLLLSQRVDAPTLQLEDSGDAVTDVQTRLADLGYFDGPVTGYFGTLTEDAVVRFQQDQGLLADGIVGGQTWVALQPSGADETLSPEQRGYWQQGDVGDTVATLQTQLNALGYDAGAPDGVFGPQTEAAVIAFQAAQGLAPDGLAGASTLAALRNPSTAAPSSSAQAATVQTAPFAPAPVETGFPAPTVSVPPPVSPSIEAQGLPTLESYPTAQPSSQFPATEQGDVLQLQQQLRSMGFYTGPLDGVMSPLVQQAIDAAQRAYGVSPSDLR
ncbi:MAG: peptidoglycan-binding protein [Kaiparowitsia implicata GSE-PSE-MK54-09C]|jgi:peptidoglycan hydrolase-like protein with peptidoglycan-binding domain|nr:peptidoglycan-binding protein [Kaiparowitsia implicata GSE-PSE-MK54-09C]